MSRGKHAAPDRSRGFTLVECLVVIVILVILVAILLPVINNARRQGRISHSISNMRQIYTGLLLYQEKHDGSMSGASGSAMGLPGVFQIKRDPEMVAPISLWTSPCGQHPDAASGFTNYYYYPSEEPYWMEYIAKYAPTAIMMTDYNCNPSGVRFADMFVEKKVIGLFLDGSIKTRVRAGDPTFLSEWWHE